MPTPGKASLHTRFLSLLSFTALHPPDANSKPLYEAFLPSTAFRLSLAMCVYESATSPPFALDGAVTEPVLVEVDARGICLT